MTQPADFERMSRKLADAERRAADAEAALRTAAETIERSAERLRQALEAGRMEYWEWDPLSDTVIRSNSLADLDSLNGGESHHTGEESFVLVHPDDRERHEAMVQAAGRNGEGWHTEVRVINALGEVRWMEERALPSIDPATGHSRITGFIWDITERKRAELALCDSEARYRNLFRTMRQGYIENELIRDVDGRAVDYRTEALNPQFERLTGVAAADAIGRTARELVGELDPAWIETYERVVRTGVPATFEREEPAFGRWFAVQAYPLTGDRFAILYDDITERRRAEVAMRDSEVRHRLLIESWTQAVWETDAAGSVVRDSPSWRAYTGQTLEQWLGYGWLDAIHPDDRAYAERQWRDAMAARSGVDAEFRLRAPGGGWRWTNVRAAPVLDAEGQIEKWASVNIDIEARKRAELALRESEARFQQFAGASAAGMWIRDATTLSMEYVSPAIARVYGVDPGAFLGGMGRWASLILPEDRDTALIQIERARQGEAVVHEFRIQRPDDKTFRWVRNTDFPLFDALGRVERIGGLAEDVTEAKLAVEHQSVLLSELQHRVRNIMAVIRSIALRTAQNAESVEDYSRVLDGRLLTLARVQVLLTQKANVGVEIRDVVRDELLAQATDAGQVVMTGPDIVLPPKTAEVLTLAIHELTTNAVKYGALSTGSGKVEATWSIEEKTSEPWLGFDWKETGAPWLAGSEAPMPRRRGFGTELIEKRIPYELGGSATVTITPGGAQCHITFPLKSMPSILETDAPEVVDLRRDAILAMELLSGSRVPEW